MRPHYAPEYERLVDGELVTFEVEYDDGSLFLQRNYPTTVDAYAMIDRDRLRAFKLVDPGGILIEMKPPEGATGHNLIYRKRIEHNLGGGGVGRHIIFLIGWAPMGPAVMIDPARGTYRTERAFIEGDEDMYPPSVYSGDGKFLGQTLASAK